MIMISTGLIFFMDNQDPGWNLLVVGVVLVQEVLVEGILGAIFPHNSSSIIFPLLIGTLGDEMVLVSAIIAIFHFWSTWPWSSP
jgi:hypothetical protein